MTTLQEAAMRKALEALGLPTPGAITGSAEAWSAWYDKRFAAMESLRTALAQQAEVDPNAPWMTEAHCLCTDHGIPQGNLTGRIRALRDKLAQQGEQPVAWLFDEAKYMEGDLRGRQWMPKVSRHPPAAPWMQRNVVPLYAGAAPAPQPAQESGLTKALADVRDLFPVPERGSNLEAAWMEACSFPESVPAYVKAALQSAQPVAPHECETEAEKLAYAAGWWKALEVNRVVRPVAERYGHIPDAGKIVQPVAPLTDEQFNDLVMQHLGPHALTGGKMSVYDAFLLAVRATEAAPK